MRFPPGFQHFDSRLKNGEVIFTDALKILVTVCRAPHTLESHIFIHYGTIF